MRQSWRGLESAVAQHDILEPGEIGGDDVGGTALEMIGAWCRAFEAGVELRGAEGRVDADGASHDGADAVEMTAQAAEMRHLLEGLGGIVDAGAAGGVGAEELDEGEIFGVYIMLEIKDWRLRWGEGWNRDGATCAP